MKRKLTVEERIVRLISKAWYTKKKLRGKLISEGYPENDVEEALQAFEQDGYIDDEFFMKTYLEGKRNSNPRGYFAYKTELERLGIEKDLLEQFRSIYYPPSEEVKDGIELIRKWFQQGETSRDRIIHRLSRKGFSYDIAEWSWDQFQANREGELS